MAVNFSQWGNDLYTGRRSYNIVGRRRTWFAVGGTLLVLSALLLIFKGFTPGIEFSGGSEFTVSGAATTEQSLAVDAVQSVDTGEAPKVTQVGQNAMRVQTRQLSDTEVQDVRGALAQAYSVPVEQVTSAYIGPTWGKDLSGKAVSGMVVFLLLVAAVMSLYFRAWRMALAAILALLHDLVITAGIYALIGWEVTPATVIGFLTILGYSIYDTVVVFDKVRENTEGVLDQTRYTYDEAANLAVNQTLVRSINTSVVALLPVASILFVGAFLLGAGTLRDISLSLFIGMIVGAFSSIFIATPLEVLLRDFEPRIKEHTAKVKALRAKAEADGGTVDATHGLAPIGATLPGSHQGQAAQPRRKRPRA